MLWCLLWLLAAAALGYTAWGLFAHTPYRIDIDIYQMGGQTWGNKSFPLRNGQDVQCLTVAPGNAAAGVPNTIPDYIWTVPTKYVILEALGDPGSTMQHLNAWWSADADT